MEQVTTSDTVAVTAALDDAGIAYSADFVPFSKSRHAKPVKSPSDLTLNWRITFTRNARAFSTDYSAGIGHLPGYRYNPRVTVDEFDAMKRACESGKAFTAGRMLYTKPIPAPDVADVVHCLLSDAEAIDCESFEEWCSQMGADTDSRKDEAIYRACVDTGLRLRTLFGDALMLKLRELLADH